MSDDTAIDQWWEASVAPALSAGSARAAAAYAKNQLQRLDEEAVAEKCSTAEEEAEARDDLYSIISSERVARVIRINCIELEEQARSALEAERAEEAASLTMWSAQKTMGLLTGSPTLSRPREETSKDEEAERASLIRRQMYATAVKRVVHLPEEESVWRERIGASERQERARLVGCIIAPVLMRWLLHPCGTHSEVQYRRFIELQEMKRRIGLLVQYHLMQVSHMEMQHRALMWQMNCVNMEEMKSRLAVCAIEHKERNAARSFYELVHADIMETLAVRKERAERRNNKLLALQHLRRLEVERLQQAERERSAYVERWKQDEIEKILAVQDSVVRDAAIHCGTGEDATWKLLSDTYTDDIQQLYTSSFGEILAYRKKLLGFDQFVTSVEEQVGVPSSTTPASIAAYQSPPPAIMDAGGSSLSVKGTPMSTVKRRMHRGSEPPSERRATLTSTPPPKTIEPRSIAEARTTPTQQRETPRYDVDELLARHLAEHEKITSSVCRARQAMAAQQWDAHAEARLQQLSEWLSAHTE